MRQRATESVQFPDDQAIAGVDVGERLLESGAIIPRSAGLLFKQMTRIDASGEQGVALQVRGLPVVVTGDPHVPHEHVRETPLVSFPSLPAIRHVFRTDFAWLCWGCQAPAPWCREAPVCRTPLSSVLSFYDIACQLLLGSSREITSCQGLRRALVTIQAEISTT